MDIIKGYNTRELIKHVEVIDKNNLQSRTENTKLI